MVYPKNRIAKVYQLNQEGRFIKQGDFESESFTFEAGHCKMNFDFGKIWSWDWWFATPKFTFYIPETLFVIKPK